MKNIIKLYRYISDERSRLIYTALLSAGLSLVGSVTPLFYRYVINQLSTLANGHNSANVGRTVFYAVVGIAVLQLVGEVLAFVRERLSDRLFVDMLVKINQRVFAHMLKLSIDYYEQTRVGETMIRVSTATQQFANWLQNVAETWLSQMIQLVLSIVLLCFISPLIGAVVVPLMGLSIFIQAWRIRQARGIRTAMRERYEVAGGHMNETISHIATIRSSVASSAPQERYESSLGEAKTLHYQSNNVEQYGNLARGIVNNISMVAAIAIVAWQSLNGHATPGDVVAVALYLQQVNQAVGPLGRLIVNTSQTDTSVERIIDLLETKPTVVDKPDAIELEHLESIEFKNVSFAYPAKKHKVLSGVSFVLEKDQNLALVGPSGTGKTTVTKLMLRFYEPTSGQILINGLPVDHFTAESIRSRIGMVMQDVALFNDTIESNLSLARPQATTAEVRAAAIQAHADVFIQNLGEKYASLVGERGIKLSGGEKQRVAIARAILKAPDMIILDEATSALDSESEAHVQAGLSDLMKGRTAVVIAHRLSTVMKADVIIVMRNGKIIERGTHKELANKRGGLYAKLFKLQTEGVLAG